MYGDIDHSTFNMLLCLVHHLTSLFNQLSSSSSKLLQENIAKDTKSNINGKLCFNSMYKYKKNLTSAQNNCCVNCQLNMQHFGELGSIFCIQKQCKQYLIYFFVLVFSLFISLQVVNSGIECFCTQESPKRFPKSHYKTWVFVTYSCLGCAETFHM